jgi:hypothetical protein
MTHLKSVALAILLALASPAAADPIGGTVQPAKDPPPAFFQDLVASLGKAGFHRDTSEQRWMSGTVCAGAEARGAAACPLIRRAWRTRVVADRRRGGEAVVQELWLFEFTSTADAAAGLESLGRDIPYGPFAKHPYELFLHGDRIVAVEGRARWHTDGVRLGAHVKAFLAGRPR